MATFYKDAAMETVITRQIRAAMAQQGMTYADLAHALAQRGIEQSESTLRSKVNNGTLTTSLFLHLMSCTQTETIDIPELMARYTQLQKN